RFGSRSQASAHLALQRGLRAPGGRARYDDRGTAHHQLALSTRNDRVAAGPGGARDPSKHPQLRVILVDLLCRCAPCSVPMAPDAPIAPGFTIGEYEVTEVLGEGG